MQKRQAEAFEESLEKLQMEYVDLYLIHWPVPQKYIKSWKVLEEIYRKKKARAIGVSNFTISLLEDLKQVAEITPAVNQCESHPACMRSELRDYCQKQGIAFEAFKPLGQGAYVKNPLLEEVALKNGKSIAQVLIRWHLQHGTIIIPKSTHTEYIQANRDVFDFELDSEEMRLIDSMNRERSTSNCTADCFDF